MRRSHLPAACALALAFGVLTPASRAQSPANVPIEVVFDAKRDHAEPSLGLTVDVVFRTPGGRPLRVPAFWAGGRTWKARYSSGEPGIHRYRSECSDKSDPGLQGVQGKVDVVPYKGTNPLFLHGPIRVSDDRRHLAHADGTPFFWLADTWWMGLCHRLRWPDEFRRLADDRVAKGFNVVQVVAGLYPDMPPFDPRGANEAGFPWEESFARIRPEYFDAADRRIRDLIDRGITPCIVGMWGYFLPRMGVEKAEQHWRYLIARYGAWPVVWCVAGEANLPYYLDKTFPSDDRGQVHGWTEVLRYVRSTDPFRRPLTIHPTAINRYTARHATDDPALLDFDMLQTPHGQRPAAEITLVAARESYEARPVMPVIDGEAAYERLSDTLPTEWTRAMFWICMTNGAAGHTYGANGIWQCNRRGQPHGASPHGGNYGVIPWDDAMNLPGSTQLGAGKAFLTRFDWSRFAPHPEWVAWDDLASTRPPDLGRWVWFPEDDPTRNAPVAARFFRRTFEVPAGRAVRLARLRAAADDQFKAWANGREVGVGGAWNDPQGFDLTALLRPGRNVVAIRADNAPGPVGANPAGLVAGLEVELDDGSTLRLGTDPTWRASRTEAPGWLEPGFDDGPWPTAADLGPHGRAPWGTLKSREPFPPLATGVVDGPRVVYRLDPKPVVIRGLTPGRAYRVIEFDPVSGATVEAGEAVADPGGAVRRTAPAHGHDSVLALVPAPKASPR